MYNKFINIFCKDKSSMKILARHFGEKNAVFVLEVIKAGIKRCYSKRSFLKIPDVFFLLQY